MFEIGDRVRTRAQRTGGHTRLPGYLQHKRGVIGGRLGEFAFADERAGGVRDARKEQLYTVAFEAREVWDSDASANDVVTADLFESYLEADR
jgi:nitrile hydratase